MIGETIGNYRITATLGQGGMGTVYAAEDSLLGRKVAIKVLNSSLMALGSTELERFKAEAKVQANLNNPNIVTLHDFQAYGDSYYMVMEYVEGKSLAELVRSFGPIAPHLVVVLVRQALEGLSSAHAMGVIHRDLKPSNIMVTSSGLAKVMDFGIAKVQGGKNLTATGALVGTVLYMSPEQVRGEPVDRRSDIYSLGIILFELLTGRVPFKEESDFSIMIHHVQTPPPPPTQLLPEIPSALEDIVLRCLEKNPDQRFQSAEEILSALDAFEEQERAMGRGQLYTRRVLAQWLSQPQAPIDPATAPTSLDPAAPSAKVAGRQAAGSQIGPDKPPTVAALAHSANPSQKFPSAPSFANFPAEHSMPKPSPQAAPAAGNSPPHSQKGNVFWVALSILVLAVAGAAYYFANQGSIPFLSAGAVPAKQTQEMHASMDMTVPAAKSDNNSIPSPEPPSAATSPDSAASAPASSGSAAPPEHPMQAEATNPVRGNTAPPAPPASGSAAPSDSQPAVPLKPSGPKPSLASTSPLASNPAVAPGTRTAPKNAARPVAQDSQPARSSQAAAARSFLILFDAEPSSERLPLAGAQAQIADIVQERGYAITSSGLLSRNVRAALDSGDLTTIRGRGIGYVVLGTANGSLSSQSAYGSTYHVASVSVNLEVVRTSDGKIAASGRATSKSRGSANPDSALNEALLAAASEGAREMMRQFKP